jgi:ECF sigma factor
MLGTQLGAALAEPSSEGITAILATLGAGDQKALKSLIPLVYDELRRLARYHLNRERSDHTLQSAPKTGNE